MDKKNLDELFQKKFLDFKEMPDEKVWNSIEASLDKKKKNRLVPLWWKLGGIAAALLIGLILFNPFGTSDIPTEETITNMEQKSDEIDATKDKQVEEVVPKKVEQNDIKIAVEDQKSLDENENTDALVNSSEHAIEQNEAKANPIKNNSGMVNKKPSIKNFSVAETENDSRKKESISNQPQITIDENEVDKTAVAETDARPNQEVIKKLEGENSSNSAINKEVISNNNGQDISIAMVDEEKQAEEVLEDSKGKSIFEEIEAQEEDVIAENSTKKWSAGPSIAPVYFNAIGEGSPVNSIFVPNSKSGDINLSYGLSVAYEVSKKLKIRSGIHKVDYGYNTNDVAFSSSLSSSTNGKITNINYTSTAENLVVTSKKGSSGNLSAANKSFDFSSQNPERNGVMSQQLGYLEVPLELNYALIDNRFGVNLIGGVSSLFLMDNSVALTSGELTTEIGEANNVNSMNFSTNIGLGVNYKFSPKVQLNVEPVFKYQLNTFSETSGDFRPYSIGIYSGLSFKF